VFLLCLFQKQQHDSPAPLAPLLLFNHVYISNKDPFAASPLFSSHSLVFCRHYAHTLAATVHTVTPPLCTHHPPVSKQLGFRKLAGDLITSQEACLAERKLYIT
jgi:hypothetical protein